MQGAAGFLQPVLILEENRSHPDKASQEREESAERKFHKTQKNRSRNCCRPQVRPSPIRHGKEEA